MNLKCIRLAWWHTVMLCFHKITENKWWLKTSNFEVKFLYNNEIDYKKKFIFMNDRIWRISPTLLHTNFASMHFFRPSVCDFQQTSPMWNESGCVVAIVFLSCFCQNKHNIGRLWLRYPIYTASTGLKLLFFSKLKLLDKYQFQIGLSRIDRIPESKGSFIIKHYLQQNIFIQKSLGCNFVSLNLIMRCQILQI